MIQLQVIQLNGKLLVDSREVAIMTEKRHDHLLRDIDGYVAILSKSTDPKIGVSDFFVESTYQDSTGRTVKCYLLTRKGCDMVANKMTGEKGVLFTAAYVTKFDEMEKALNQPQLPQTYKEALLALVAAEEEKERLEAEKAQLEIEVGHKEAVIIGLVDEIDLATKRQIINRVVRKAGNKYQDRWRELYKQFEMKYHVGLQRNLDNYNKVNKPKLKNKMDYIDKVMGKVPELYEIACKLYENDVKQLVNEMYELNGQRLSGM